MYLLDTNIISYWMRGDRSVIDRIRKHSPADLFLSTITLAEILYGIEKSSVKKSERRLKIDRITSVLGLCVFDAAAAFQYATIRAQLEKQGQMISERDTQIASIAMANKFIVVTHNTKEFERIGKLKIEAWAADMDTARY